MFALIKNLVLLAVIVIAVHFLYLGYILPEADAVLTAAAAAGKSAPRELVVILKDLEQEICIALGLWAACLIVMKSLSIARHRYMYKVDLLASDDENQDMKQVLAQLEALDDDTRETPLVQTLLTSLRRFLITRDVQNTSDAIESGVEALAIRLESENSMIRYLIWAIPSIGFIGTVRGIGQALSQADLALAGDIAGMTDSLGVAFNSTLVALIVSIILMLLLHGLQRLQDDVIVRTQAYCESFLLNRISKVASH
ncbi:MotA/TolQ/ExbB proton channel family protein [Aestuariispira insulae]|uniref:Biopolymer transport protein ExbB/TolQ n=1 Tax=Aestuariispira insulae TaxID=1461337 RepID=A0A3D9H5S8_9PROT|nr:MotA/TolQ/ExbB proton channel family protein [Aestuariispira insulae]RED44858.1 biopolymer transport protein ExbB/TolQ [Aestuariispira insulae]